MKGMIQETSLEAYYDIKDKLGPMHRLILNIIKTYPNVSNHEISNIIHKPINSVTPRVKELRAMGFVIQGATKVDRQTNKNVMTWVAVP
jgi:predicted transcriptional regulator